MTSLQRWCGGGATVHLTTSGPPPLHLLDRHRGWWEGGLVPPARGLSRWAWRIAGDGRPAFPNQATEKAPHIRIILIWGEACE